MRVVIDGRRLTAERTGVGRYLESLLAEWARTELPAESTVVVLRDRAGLACVPNARGLTALVAGEGLPGLLWERWALGRVPRAGDVLFAPTNLQPARWRGPSVVVLFDTLQESRPRDFPWLTRVRFGSRYRAAARLASRVIVPSVATAADVTRHYGVSSELISIVRPAHEPHFQPLAANHRDVRLARESLGIGRAPFFLFIGKRSKRRHVAETLEAFARVRERSTDALLVFVGPDGSRLPRLGDGVIVAGHVSETALRGLLASAVALVYPSEQEGFGLPVVEAMACGCPVVTLRRAALAEAGGDAALYLDEATPSALAAAMSSLLEPALRSNHAARGLDHVSRWTRADFAAAITRELRAVVRQARAA